MALLCGIAAIGLIGCGDSGTGENHAGHDGPPFTEAKTTGDCPAALHTGSTSDVTFKVTNTGKEDWPRSYVGFTDLSHVGLVSIGGFGGKGQNLDVPGDFATYALPGLKAGETGKVLLILAGKEVGNVDLSLSVWGDRNSDGIPPGRANLVGCKSIPVLP